MRQLGATQKEEENKASKCVCSNLGLCWYHPEQRFWKARLDTESVIYNHKQRVVYLFLGETSSL